MAITAAQVNELRQKTGVSMMACKKALEEAQGNEEQAIEILRKRGEAKAVDKAGRETKEGAVAVYVSGNKGALVKMNCETDFVGRNEDFVAVAEKIAKMAVEQGSEAAQTQGEAMVKEAIAKLGENMSLGEIQTIEGDVLGSYIHSNRKLGAVVAVSGGNAEQARDTAMHVTATRPAVVSPEEVSEELVMKEKEIWKAQLQTEGKPENIWDKIMMGKEKKFREEAALMKQPFVKNPEQTIEQYLAGGKVQKFIFMSV